MAAKFSLKLLFALTSFVCVSIGALLCPTYQCLVCLSLLFAVSFLVMIALSVGCNGRLRLQAIAFVVTAATLYALHDNEQFPFQLGIQPFVSFVEYYLDPEKVESLGITSPIEADKRFLRPICSILAINIAAYLMCFITGLLHDHQTSSS